MDQTAYWMLGVIAFGIVFYCFAVYYSNQNNLD